ncbi:MAG: hypothetical protein BWY31_02298 [Lentisphaerae bacterium ADurb.Bin242]|nr:MAG: hypothetical protein BWY31_02298 [Lentisphaerae bacterium ADurb.Bin242]
MAADQEKWVDIQENADLHMTPQGMLRDSLGTFDTGNGVGLPALTQSRLSETADGAHFFQKLFSSYIRKLSAFGDPAGKELSGLFQAALAGRLDLGVMTVGNWERGKSLPGWIHLEKLNRLEKNHAEIQRDL